MCLCSAPKRWASGEEMRRFDEDFVLSGGKFALLPEETHLDGVCRRIFRAIVHLELPARRPIYGNPSPIPNGD